MSKLRILHIVTALSWRGGEQQVTYLLGELKAEVDAFVLCSVGSVMEQYCIQNRINYTSVKKGSGIDLFYAKRIKEVCVEYQIDLIHLHDAHAHTYAILAADFWKNKVPLILSRRVDFPIKKKWTSKHKYNHSQIKKILCVSDKIREITSQGIKDKSKLKTVYSGIDLNKFAKPNNTLREEYGISEDVFLVGNTSALADHKDYFTFLDVVKMVTDQEKSIRFIIMGDGPMMEEIKTYAKQLNLEKQVIFTGFRNDIPTVITGLDLFFISSKTEGLGTSILDAFAAGVPVLATAAGGIPELVKDEETGLLRQVGDAAGLSQAIFRLQTDKKLREQLVKNASLFVQRFDKSNTAKQTFKCYKEALFPD